MLVTVCTVSCSRKTLPVSVTPEPTSSDSAWYEKFQKIVSSVNVGMDKTDVLNTIGEPHSRQRIKHKQIREIWKYELEPDIRFQVNFDEEGKVVGQQLDAPKFIRW